MKRTPHLGENYGDEYLEKIFQVTYELPLIHEDKMKEYFGEKAKAFDDYGHILVKYSDVIIKSLGDTPRKIKRFFNNLSIQIKIAYEKKLLVEEREGEKKDDTKIRVADYIHWNVLKEAYHDIYEIVHNKPQMVGIVAEKWRELGSLSEEDAIKKIDEINPVDARPILKNKNAREIVLELPRDQKVIEKLKFESEAVGTARVEVGEDRKIRIGLPPPGAMVKVEKGEFLYGEGKETKRIEADFEIDVYPVTNEEYCRFLNEKGTGGENIKKWISLEESMCRIKHNAGKYLAQTGYERHPVLYVSWHGAKAYADWAEKRLPTEQEWEKAARGPEGWIYPWGDNFDSKLCNTSESGIGGTTEVDRYPNGKSYYGCFDMAGNVWEWTESWYDKDKGAKVLCGGSWDRGAGDCRCAYRGSLRPVYRVSNIGFRCARTLKGSDEK